MNSSQHSIGRLISQVLYNYLPLWKVCQASKTRSFVEQSRAALYATFVLVKAQIRSIPTRSFWHLQTKAIWSSHEDWLCRILSGCDSTGRRSPFGMKTKAAAFIQYLLPAATFSNDVSFYSNAQKNLQAQVIVWHLYVNLRDSPQVSVQRKRLNSWVSSLHMQCLYLVEVRRWRRGPGARLLWHQWLQRGAWKVCWCPWPASNYLTLQ